MAKQNFLFGIISKYLINNKFLTTERIVGDLFSSSLSGCVLGVYTVLGATIAMIMKWRAENKGLKDRMDRYVRIGEMIEKREKLYLDTESSKEVERIVSFLSDEKKAITQYQGGACFFGAPGLGKSSIAGYIALKANVNVIVVKELDLLSNKEDVYEIYKLAKSFGKCLILIDEFCIIPEAPNKNEAKQIKSDLVELIKNEKLNIAVIGASNQVDKNTNGESLFNKGILKRCDVKVSRESNIEFIKDTLKQRFSLNDTQEKSVNQSIKEFCDGKKSVGLNLLSLRDLDYWINAFEIMGKEEKEDMGKFISANIKKFIKDIEEECEIKYKTALSTQKRQEEKRRMQQGLIKDVVEIKRTVAGMAKNLEERKKPEAIAEEKHHAHERILGGHSSLDALCLEGHITHRQETAQRMGGRKIAQTVTGLRL